MKYRKKPVVIDAWQFVGNVEDELRAIISKPPFKFLPVPTPDGTQSINLFIETLEGNMLVSPGDYIIRGVAGEYYACKPDIFEKTYEPVEVQE